MTAPTPQAPHEGSQTALGRRRAVWRLRPAAPIWPALALLAALMVVFVPASLNRSSLVTLLPFLAFLALAACGQLLVVMMAGIDLSVPAVIAMAGIVMLKVSAGQNGRLALAIVVVMVVAVAIGALNGLLVAFLRIPPLVATLAMGGLVTGATLSYRGDIQAESVVPGTLSRFGVSQVLGSDYLSSMLVVAVGVASLMTLVLRFTRIGRTFIGVGANPRAARVAGVRTRAYLVGGYAVAGALYGLTGLLLAGFVRTPGSNLGDPYLLTTVVAVVLSGASLAGGIGSPFAVLGGALFVVALEQALKVQGSATGIQLILQGVVIVASMALRSVPLSRFTNRVPRLWSSGRLRKEESA